MRRSVRWKSAIMTAAESEFPTDTAAKTVRSPSPSHCVHTTDATNTPITRMVIQASGSVARPRPWSANAGTMLTATNGYDGPTSRK